MSKKPISVRIEGWLSKPADWFVKKMGRWEALGKTQRLLINPRSGFGRLSVFYWIPYPSFLGGVFYLHWMDFFFYHSLRQPTVKILFALGVDTVKDPERVRKYAERMATLIKRR